jgi:hypothetical protein
MAREDNFYETLTKAINFFLEHGYTTQADLKKWMKLLKISANSSLQTPKQVEKAIKANLKSVYSRFITQKSPTKYHEGVTRFTVDMLKPAMQRELNKRILASAELIKLNREEAINKTLRRFSGWATSIPQGGSTAIDKVAEKQAIRKSLAQLPFEERRVIIDQGHKLLASINDVIATKQGAIAVEWNSQWRQANYDYREDHKERDEKVYLLRDTWATEKGLVKPNEDGYYDQITAVAEEPYCRCFARYIYNLKSLPNDMLTAKGRDLIAPKSK